jgi:hypothetical protein
MACSALLLVSCYAVATAAIAAARTTVQLPGQGAVNGVQLPGSRYWYGIPFAAPPIGALRWRAPQLRAPWHGVRDASLPQPQCMQHSPGWRGSSMSEDCLYVSSTRSALSLPCWKCWRCWRYCCRCLPRLHAQLFCCVERCSLIQVDSTLPPHRSSMSSPPRMRRNPCVLL